ncbi:MAG: GNAT family N-acetyltransferase [Lachnospiraceae bacterium]|nr:GNAT family N-acetyltransferase [Ruminococcus sp.]MCM1274416.1 GNAT family N-acetyltransferase [Lachnospiraceae bacterium]
MSIRKAEPRDIPRIMELLSQVLEVHAAGRPDLFKSGTTKYSPHELGEIIADSERPIFVAEHDEVVRGYAFCVFQRHEEHNAPRYTTLYIDDLCVDESSRGMHVGSALYGHVLKFAKESGCYNVTLNVWACNESAMRFYEKCGLQVQKIGMEKIL